MPTSTPPPSFSRLKANVEANSDKKSPAENVGPPAVVKLGRRPPGADRLAPVQVDTDRVQQAEDGKQGKRPSRGEGRAVRLRAEVEQRYGDGADVDRKLELGSTASASGRGKGAGRETHPG